MATLASLSIDLVANSAKLVNEVKKANKSLGTIEKTARQVSGVIKLAIGAVAVGAFKNLATESINTADSIGKLAFRLGTTSEAISELHYVANLSGVSINAMNMGLQRMTRRVAEAAVGTGEAQGALRELNISAKDLNQLAPEKQFEVISDAIHNLTTESDKVRLSMKLFDSEGVALIQTMGGGAQGIRDMRAEAKKMGASISTEASMAAANFNDEMLRMNTRMDAITRVTSIAFVNVFNDVANALDIAKGNVEKFDVKSESIEEFFKGIVYVGTAATYVITLLGESLAGMAAMGTELGKGNFSNMIDEGEIAHERILEMEKTFDRFIEKLYAKKDAPTAISNSFGAGDVGVDVGGSIGGADAIEKAQAAADAEFWIDAKLKADKFAALEESLASEEQLKIESYEKQLTTISEFAESQKSIFAKMEMDILEEANKIKAGDEKAQLANIKKHNQFIAMRKNEELKLEKATASAKRGIMKAAFTEQLAEAGKYSRAAFNAQKALALSDGVIKAKESVLGAYAFGSKIGGPAVGAAFAAIAGVVAYGHLKDIASAQFGGGGGSSGGGTTTIAASTPIIDSGETTGEIVNNQDESKTKTIIFNVEGVGDAELLPKSVVRGLIDMINEEKESNVRVLI